MSKGFGPIEEPLIIRFGGGLNTRASEDEINPREAASGQNFVIDLKNSAFRSRQPFDLVATTPNTGQINGFISLLKSDGTVSLLVQSGTEVYELSSGHTFGTTKGTVSSSARLRGRIEHNWQLSDKVIITDIALAQPLMEWNGTTLQNITFTTEDGSTAWTGQFRARYAVVDNERLIVSNIYDNGSSYPHMIVGSQRGDYTIMTVNQRPSSALAEDDPFFLIQPDYRYINGMVQAFDTVVTSSRKGSIYKLTGGSAKDFAFGSMFPGSGVSGSEALTFIGNDIAYGRDGRIESLRQSDKNYDVEQDDLSASIADAISGYDDWTITYNSRSQRVHCISSGTGVDYVLHKPTLGSELSPWMKFTTTHSSGFQPTAIMNAYDPADGLEYIFFGDASGNVYKMEGTGSSGDGGTTDITVTRRSAMFSAKLDATAFNLEGWIRYRASSDTEISLKILSGGFLVYDSVESITLPASSSYNVYRGGAYYGGDYYYSASLNARLRREKFVTAGGTNEFQVEIQYIGTGTLDIQEIGLRLQETA